MKIQKLLMWRSTTLLLLLSLGGLFPAHALPPAPWVGKDLNGLNCRGGVPGSGPYDYLQRGRYGKELRRVERRHFTPQVERLIRGESDKSAYGVTNDLDYTLRQWPNHHRALNALMDYHSMHPKRKSGNRYIPVECYLQRAIAFSPRDSISAMLYALFLHRTGYKERALTQYRVAENIAPGNRQNQYNLALLLVQMKKFDEAKTYAKKLYGEGFPLKGLKNKLVNAGQWSLADEPPNRDE